MAVAIVIVLLGVVPTANLVTAGVGLPWYGLAVREWLAWGVLMTCATMALGFAVPDAIERNVKRATQLLLAMPPAVFAALVGVIACGLSVFAGWRLFDLAPVVGDEFAQRWQAHLLALGRLSARRDPNPEFFSTVETLVVGDRWFSQFPMGGPALLALGLLAHAPWLVNPLLAGVAAIAVYRFASATFDESTARVTGLLFALCPFVLMMAGSEMNHVGSLAFLWVALAALPAWKNAASGRTAHRAAALIGGCIGIAAAIRPFDAAVFALAVGVFQLNAVRTNRALGASLVTQVCVGTIPVALLLVANVLTTGGAFAFAYDVLNGAEHRPGFHMTPLAFEHTPRRGLYMISAYLMKLDVGLFAWPVPAMLIVALGIGLLRKVTEWDRLMFLVLAGILAGYSVYWSESYFVGPRFLFAIAPVFVIYTARFTTTLRAHVRQPRIRAAIVLLIPLWLLASWIAPARETQFYGIGMLGKIYHARGTADAIEQAVRDGRVTHAVVFLGEGWHSRLTARLRELGLRPLAAETAVLRYDACTLQTVLDQVDASVNIPREVRLDMVLARAEQDPPTSRTKQLSSDQIALVPNRPLSAGCAREFSQPPSLGVSIAEILPHQSLDSSGAIGGDVVYARDFGPHNEVLRNRFGDRAWLRARTEMVDGALRVRLEPYR